MKTKLTALFLCTAALLLSCGDQQAETPTVGETPDNPETAAQTEEASFPAYPGELTDFGGYTFTFLNQSDDFWTGAHHVLDYETDTGESVESAVYKRNRAAEEALNFHIAVEKDELQNMRTKMQKAVTAGEDAYDAVYLSLFYNQTSFGSSYVLNLKDISTLNLTEPWWNQSYISSALLQGDVLYTSIDYVNLMGYAYINMICFNRDMMRRLDLDMPYDLVRSGKWTYDAMLTYMKAAVSPGEQADFKYDINGSAIYGFACQHEEGPTVLLQGTGSYVIVRDKDNMPILSPDITRLSDAADKLTAMLSGDGYCVMTNEPNSSKGQGIGYFLGGRALFYHSSLGSCDSARFRESDVEYGILPTPKLDESQEQYYSNLSQYTFALNIPAVASDPERTGTIIDYLAYLSYRDVIPVLFESFCYKGVRDEDSIDMLNLLMDTETIDFGSAAGISTDFMTEISKQIVTGKTQFASAFEKKTKTMEKAIEKLFAE